jgi:ABC-2 type transport system permease protein
MNTGPIEMRSQPVPQRPGNAEAARPSFLRAFRGLWLFTWRTQLSWGRLPMKAFGLVVLPALIYLTTLTAQKWAERYSPFGNPALQVSMLSRRFERAGVPFRPDQRKLVGPIFAEEFARAEHGWRESETSQTGDLRQQIRACYTRIGNRLQPVLDDRQLSEFRDFERHNLSLSERRTNEPRWNWTAPFYHWLVDFYFFVILPLTCVRTSGALIRDELQADTLGFLLTRPLSRGRLLLLKYLTQTAWLQMLLLIETLLIFAAGELRHIPELGALLPLFIAVQFLAVCAWSALGAMLGLISNRYIALALLYGLIVEMGIGRIPTNINNLSVMRHLKTLLAQNPALQSSFEWSGGGAALSVGALVLATAVFAGMAVLLFAFIEYQHATEVQK